MTKTLIVPGIGGSPAPHWQHWWAATDPEAIMVDLSEPDAPVPMVWEIELAGMILRHPDSVLVAHGLGAVLVSRLLANWPHLRVKAALLVAPVETEGSRRTGQFGKIPEQELGIPAIVAASRNDPHMSFLRARQLSRLWKAELQDMGLSGHVDAEAGFGPWPGGLALRDDLIERAEPVDPTPVMPARQPLRRASRQGRGIPLPMALRSALEWSFRP